MAEEEKKEVKISFKLPKINVWAISTVILAFAVIAVWFFKPTGPTGFATQVLPAEEAAKKQRYNFHESLFGLCSHNPY